MTQSLEEMKKKAREDWAEIVHFCKKRKDGPSVLTHENFLDTLIEQVWNARGEEINEEFCGSMHLIRREASKNQLLLLTKVMGAFRQALTTQNISNPK